MIKNLNKQSFAPFGKVLRDSLPNRGFPKGDDYVERVHYFSAGELYYYRCAEPIYLDFELGMTVLVIRQKNKRSCFYLDKPLTLQPGMVFAIVPYQQECSVRLSIPVGVSLERLERVDSVDGLKITDRLHLGERTVYTELRGTEVTEDKNIIQDKIGKYRCHRGYHRDDSVSSLSESARVSLRKCEG